MPLEPQSDPEAPKLFADWVIANVENNMWAFIIAGTLGLLLTYILVSIARKSPLSAFKVEKEDAPVRNSLLLVAAIIAVAALALWLWDGFKDHAHNWAAVLMFGFLALASLYNARNREDRKYVRIYAAVPALMALSAAVIFIAGRVNDDWQHAVLVLEIVEIGLFAAYWAAQTKEHWNQEVVPPQG